MTTRKTLQIGIGAIFFILVVIYSIFQARLLIQGPSLVIYSPKNGETITEDKIAINGEAKQAAFITLNGHQIFTDENGVFSETIPLLPGYNIITVATKDKFSRVIEERINIINK